MRIARLDDISLHWREDGDPSGRAVVFANSLGTDLRLWDQVIPLLPQNLRYVRFDKRGHGLSDCPPAPYNIGQLADDVVGLLDHLGITESVFVGLSIGGMIGQMLAARHPERVRALVLSNTAAKMGEASAWHDRIAAIEAKGIEAVADPIMERWFGTAFRTSPNLTAWRNMLTRTPVNGYLGCCHAIAQADLSNTSAQLMLPVLALAGTEDQASPPDLVRTTAEMIAGARFEQIDGVGHLPCVEDPQGFARLLTEFLEDLRYV
ncbi:putative 3-oxoadipate enol-lactonase (plasmid) [Phaeobacter inhibens]|uniref:3-oxoadipate enol-lactonase n=1 Tax=Phaeobacter inhibens TaxID=221822 RepID=A0ABM6RKW8_9RHOB|nr:3-oxoadipate enol-lactonase [Phaeobacter inhibens]AUQ52471.1 putative 3-oxoadipate enol-lactonase [Phaeobacter inhibens]AUQ97076.1 putative 3-oxoadipate enol-lactonase [Phaeobacter inhibens]AUR22276.1 putative 3-oxoadipate enol-lactonase [Phaeobacter inhibens]